MRRLTPAITPIIWSAKLGRKGVEIKDVVHGEIYVTKSSHMEARMNEFSSYV